MMIKFPKDSHCILLFFLRCRQRRREKNSQRTFWFLWGPELLCIFVFLTAGHALSKLFILPRNHPTLPLWEEGGVV